MAKDSKFKIIIETLLKGSGINAGIKAFDSLGTAIKRTFNALGHVVRNLNTFYFSAKRITATLFAPLRVAGDLFRALGVAVAGSVIEGARFNVQMARVWTMAGGGVTNFRALRKEARGLSQDFGLARSEMAGGFYKALSAGVERNQLEDFMRVAARAAVADGSDIATAVDGITTVLDSFGMASSEAGRMADLMFQSVAKGKLTFQELAQYISQSASVASSLGVSAEEVFGAISQLSKTGKVSQATVQLRNVMLALNKAMGEGWSETMTLQQALQTLYERVGGSQIKLEKIFGRENITAVLKMVGANAREAQRYLEDMYDSAGAATEAFGRVQQFRHWETSLQSIRGWVSKLGEMLDNRIKPAVDAIGAKFREWTSDTSLWASIGNIIDVAAARLEAAFRTARDFSEIIRDNVARGGEGLGRIIGAMATNAIDSLLDALVAALKASLEIWKLIGNVIGSAIMEQVLKYDIPGINTVRKSAARKSASAMSDAEAETFMRETGAVSAAMLKSWTGSMQSLLLESINSMSVETQAQLAAMMDGQATQRALENFATNLRETGAQVRDAWSANLDKLEEALLRITGISFDFQSTAAAYERAALDRNVSPEADEYREGKGEMVSRIQREAAEKNEDAAELNDRAANTSKDAAALNAAAAATNKDAASIAAEAAQKAAQKAEQEAAEKGHRENLIGNYDSKDFEAPFGRRLPDTAPPSAAPALPPSVAAGPSLATPDSQGAGQGVDQAAQAVAAVKKEVDAAAQKMVQQVAQLQGAVNQNGAATASALASVVSVLSATNARIDQLASQINNLRA